MGRHSRLLMTTPLTQKQYERLVLPRTHLWWWVGDQAGMSLECVVEGILGRGDRDDVRALFSEVPIRRVMGIFEKQTCGPRTNYHPRTIHYFRLYFNRYA